MGIDKVEIGASASTVRRRLGTSTRAFTTHRGRKAESWRFESGDQLETVYESGRVAQVKATTDRYRFADSRKDTRYKQLRSAIYHYDSLTGRGVRYRDDINGGVAYVYAVPGDTSPRPDSLVAIVVHRKGRAAIPTEVKDLSNRGSVSPNEASCKAFVQEFYDWYVKATRTRSFDTAVTARRSSFSKTLVDALNADLAASKKNQEEIVGLDFDPILNSQDTAERYVVRSASQSAGRFRALVFAQGVGGDEKRPAVIPVLEYRSDRWVFTNFVYPGSGNEKSDDLLSILKSLANARKTKRP